MRALGFVFLGDDLPFTLLVLLFFVPLGFVPVALERLGELLGATDDLVAWVVVIVCTQCTTKKKKYG